MEKYIITMEDGAHFITTEVTQDDKDAAEDGIISIIRLSDGKLYNENDEWEELPTWGDW